MPDPSFITTPSLNLALSIPFPFPLHDFFLFPSIATPNLSTPTSPCGLATAFSTSGCVTAFSLVACVHLFHHCCHRHRIGLGHLGCCLSQQLLPLGSALLPFYRYQPPLPSYLPPSPPILSNPVQSPYSSLLPCYFAFPTPLSNNPLPPCK